MKAGVRFETVLASGPGNHGRLQKSMILGGCKNTISNLVKITQRLRFSVELTESISYILYKAGCPVIPSGGIYISFAMSLSGERVLRAGGKYSVEVALKNLGGKTIESPCVIVRRLATEIVGINMLDWEWRDHGNPATPEWWMYYYPERDLPPSGTLLKIVFFDVSPTKKFGIHGLHFTATGRIGSGDEQLVTTKWNSRVYIVLPRVSFLRYNLVPRDVSLRELMRDPPPKGWKLELIVPEFRKVEGYVGGFCADYRRNEKRVALFAFQFNNLSCAQAFFENKLQEWDARYKSDGERSVVDVSGQKIIRWILPRRGVAYGWQYGKFVFAMYGPTAEDSDIRNFARALKLT